MALQGMSKTHVYATASRPALAIGAGNSIVKIAILAAIVAMFGLALYFFMGRPQNPVGSPVAARDAAEAASDAANAQRTPVEQPAVADAGTAQRDNTAQAATADTAVQPSTAPPATAQADASAPAAKPDAAPAATASAAPASSDVDSSGPAVASADSSAPATAPAAAAPKKTHATHRQARAKPADTAANTATADAGAAAPPPARQASLKPDAVSTLNPWWAAGGTESFRITAVSPVQGQQALAVVFSEPVKADAAEHLRLLNNDGSPASGSWSAGANPGVLVRKDLAPGRYILFVGSAVASANGQAFGADLSGPAYVLALSR